MQKVKAFHYRLNSDQLKKVERKKTRKDLSQVSRPSTIIKSAFSSPRSGVSSPHSNNSKIKNFLNNSNKANSLASSRTNINLSNLKISQVFSFSSAIEKMFPQPDDFLGKTLENKYTILEKIGEGAFSRVYKTINTENNEILAMKISKREFKAKRSANSEVKILKSFKGVENIAQIIDDFLYEGCVCIVLELYEQNLYNLLSKTGFDGLPIKLIKVLTKQILTAFAIFEKLGLCHADIKPENIFIKNTKSMGVKIGDFGCSFYGEIKNPGYMQSRYYRAPEVLLNSNCNSSIDIWSLGCILCELFVGVPIFQGCDSNDQLGKIISYLGPPPKSLTKNISAECSEIVKTRERVYNIQSYLRCSSEFADFVQECLRYSDRLSPENALLHQWLN